MRRQDAYLDQPMKVSCGQCIGCRLERSRQWAIRATHESQMHDDNCFVTLTYDDDNLPRGAGLNHADFALFMKRLRRSLDRPIRFLMCGEYGETTQRPHYHALVFGWRPTDPELFSQSGDHSLFESKFLRDRWGMGHCSFGELTFESAAYVGRYTTKKLTGAASSAYTIWDSETGEIFENKPPYLVASRDPPIGASWLERYGRQTYDQDQVVLRGRSFRPPLAYDRHFERTDPASWQTVRMRRAVARYRRYEAHHVDAAKYCQELAELSIETRGTRFHPSDHFERENASRRKVAGEKIAEARLQSRSGI